MSYFLNFMPKSDLYIGVLSGTSADSIDALLVDFSNSIKVIDRFSIKIPKAVKDKIFELVLNKKLPNFANKQKELDYVLGELIGKCVNELIIKAKIEKRIVKAIGSMVRHKTQHFEKKSFQFANWKSRINKKAYWHQSSLRVPSK